MHDLIERQMIDSLRTCRRGMKKTFTRTLSRAGTCDINWSPRVLAD